MASSMKFLCTLGLILLIGIVVDGAGECGTSSPDNEANKLASCAEAAQDAKVAVPGSCCAQLRTFNARCLCAVILSQAARLAGVDPKIAFTVPNRCNSPKFPFGYKCGPYIILSVVD